MTTSPIDAEPASRTPAGQLHSRAIAVPHLVSRVLAAPSQRTDLLTAIGERVLPAPDEPVGFEHHIKSLFRRHEAFRRWVESGMSA